MVRTPSVSRPASRSSARRRCTGPSAAGVHEVPGQLGPTVRCVDGLTARTRRAGETPAQLGFRDGDRAIDDDLAGHANQHHIICASRRMSSCPTALLPPSPYLLQHRDNPVDWQQWSPEAFAEAARRDVPVLLSVGYSACHWCHVMAHESFEDDEVAALMNDRFVNVKVDREERPDVDAVYMEATLAMTGHGGWPMTVFCTPAGKPFYCGTYFPPQPRYGMPSFSQVLMGVAEAWRERREQLLEVGADGSPPLGTYGSSTGAAPPAADQLDAVRGLREQFDRQHGGFGGAPKFPPSMVLEFLLRHHARTGDDEALRMVQITCERMARGGMYDQLGGGFARYSVDDRWVVPHFEKMLYDNALLLRVYLHWYRATESLLAMRIARETADWMLRDLRTPQGGFASAVDADSEGVEGRYYVWTPQEVGPEAASLFSVTPEGTFEHGTSVLQLLQDPVDPDRWSAVRSNLVSLREQRVPPGRDDKVVAAWNGLAIAALAEAGAVLSVPEYVSAAIAAAELLVSVRPGRPPRAYFAERSPGDGRRRPGGLRRCGRGVPDTVRSHRSGWLARSRGAAARRRARALHRRRGRLLRYGR